MSNDNPILTYARPKTRRWWRWVVIGVIAVAAVWVGWKYQPVVRQRISDWSKARDYAKRFDAVAALAADGKPFVWNGDEDRNIYAAEMLRSLRGHAPRKTNDKPEEVLFIRTGGRDQFGEPWLVVGYADMGLIRVTTFYRDGWQTAPGSGGTAAQVGPMKIVRMTPLDTAGDSFEMVVNVKDADNVFHWRRGTTQSVGARPTIPIYSAVPTTGWRFDGRWEPLNKDVTLRTARQTPTTLPAVWGMMAMSFADDGTIRMEDDKRYTNLSIETGKMTPYTYFKIRRSRMPEVVDFDRPRWVAVSENYYVSTNSGQTVLYRHGGESVATLPPVGRVTRASISPNQRWVLLQGLPDTILFDIDNKRAVWTTQTMWSQRSAISWTPDSRLGVLAMDRGVFVWNTDEPRSITHLPHTAAMNNYVAAISPDGKLLAVTKTGGVISYWTDLTPTTQPASP